MGANKATTWVAGAAVAVVAILAAGWFLAISPTMASADESRAQTTVTQDRNTQLSRKVATLKDQFAHLDEYKTQLAALQVQLPQEADMSGFNTELQSLASSASVTATSMTVTTPQLFVPIGTKPTASTTAAPASDAAGTASTTSTSAANFSGLYAVPVSITTVGTYDATLTFLDSLQRTSSRLFLVGSLDATTQPNAGASNGRPATSAGDLETVTTGFAYVLHDAAGAAPAPTSATPAPTPTALPAPSSQRNPFIPVH
jgi:Tfp pilus assembly protein PilO